MITLVYNSGFRGAAKNDLIKFAKNFEKNSKSFKENQFTFKIESFDSYQLSFDDLVEKGHQDGEKG